MIPSEMEKLLKSKKILLNDFDIQYVIPCIRYENGKEVVAEFEFIGAARALEFRDAIRTLASGRQVGSDFHFGALVAQWAYHPRQWTADCTSEIIEHLLSDALDLHDTLAFEIF